MWHGTGTGAAAFFPSLLPRPPAAVQRYCEVRTACQLAAMQCHMTHGTGIATSCSVIALLLLLLLPTLAAGPLALAVHHTSLRWTLYCHRTCRCERLTTLVGADVAGCACGCGCGCRCGWCVCLHSWVWMRGGGCGCACTQLGPACTHTAGRGCSASCYSSTHTSHPVIKNHKAELLWQCRGAPPIQAGAASGGGQGICVP